MHDSPASSSHSIEDFVYEKMPPMARDPYLLDDEAKALYPMPKHIRLFKLHPGDFNDSLQGTLFVREHNEPYEALSYAGGATHPDSSSDTTLLRLLQPNHRVCSIQISISLASALRQLRLGHRVRDLWVDRLSINQEDQTEKSSQIAIMDKTYHNAERVCAWLDVENNASDKAMDLCHRLSRLQDFNQLVYEGSMLEWEALSFLMRRPWFSR